MAGGTDLMPLIKNGIRRPSCLIDLDKFDALNGIEKREKDLFMGAHDTPGPTGSRRNRKPVAASTGPCGGECRVSADSQCGDSGR